MTFPVGWQNPITVQPGQVQQGIDPLTLLPARPNLQRTRLEAQRLLLLSGTPRTTPIRVTLEGVIWDGHHAVRAAAEEGRSVEVLVVDITAPPAAHSILLLPMR